MPHAKIAEIGELLDPCDKLRVQWGNQPEIPFAGWMDIKFELATKPSEQADSFHVPFLLIE